MLNRLSRKLALFTEEFLSTVIMVVRWMLFLQLYRDGPVLNKTTVCCMLTTGRRLNKANRGSPLLLKLQEQPKSNKDEM